MNYFFKLGLRQAQSDIGNCYCLFVDSLIWFVARKLFTIDYC